MRSREPLAGRGALVTGGASGIGYAIAERLLEEGARVALLDIDETALGAAAAGLAAVGEVHAVHADVAVPEDVARGVDEAEAALGVVEILANNAGIAAEEPFLEIEVASWNRILEVNLRGVFLTAQAVARKLVAAGRPGAIVNMSSTNGLVGEAGYAHYDASKAGVANLTRTMALELGAHGIRVNAVCPGYIATPMSQAIDDEAFVRSYVERHIPLGRTGTPGDVAAAVAFLASDDAAFVTGAMLVIDGGQLAS